MWIQRISERNICHWKTSSLIFCCHSKHFSTLPTRQDTLFRHEETETYETLLLLPTALHIYLFCKIRDSANHCLLKSSGVNDCTCCNACCTLNSPLSCLKIKGNPSSAIDEDNEVWVLCNLFLAGTETATTTLHWALLHILNYPREEGRLMRSHAKPLGLCFLRERTKVSTKISLGWKCKGKNS